MTNSADFVNLMLQEKGFSADPANGKAIVLADEDGKKFNLRIATLPNGVIGGELVVPRLDTVRPNSKSYINKSPVVYEITLKRKGCLGNFSIRAINAQTFAEEHQSGSFLVSESGEVRQLGTEYPEFLQDAILSAYERSLEGCPGRLFYGEVATDGRPIERHWKTPKQ